MRTWILIFFAGSINQPLMQWKIQMKISFLTFEHSFQYLWIMLGGQTYQSNKNFPFQAFNFSMISLLWSVKQWHNKGTENSSFGSIVHKLKTVNPIKENPPVQMCWAMPNCQFCVEIISCDVCDETLWSAMTLNDIFWPSPTHSKSPLILFTSISLVEQCLSVH